MAIYVIGVDIGGTSTRVAITDRNGTVTGAGGAGGGNPVTHGPAAATGELTRALREALTGHDPTGMAGAVIGMAGVGPASQDPVALAAFADAWRAAGLSCPYRLVPDPLVAFASASTSPDGSIVIAGTGAVAGRIAGYQVRHLADGHGWLLGDRGSAYWLGRRAVRAALDELDHRVPLSPLAASVLEEVLGGTEVADPPRRTASALVGAVAGQPPIALARLAPLVSAACEAGDATARAIVGAAADALTQTLDVVRGEDAGTPVVLGGALLVSSPLGTVLRGRLGIRWPDAPVLVAGDGARGAARLALDDMRAAEAGG